MSISLQTRTWIVVGLLVLAQIVAYADRTTLSVAIAAEDFKEYFNLSSTLRGDVSSAFFWTYAFLQIPAGALADRFGVKYTLGVSFVVWSLISAATGWTTALWQLFVCRLLLGIGEAAITPAGMRWIRYNIDEHRRGLAVGLFMAGAKFGPAIGSLVAAHLLRDYGWRVMFVVIGLGSLVWLIPWAKFARNDDRELEAAAAKKSGVPSIPFAHVFKSPAIYGVIIGTFAYNYFNFFCMTWMPSYFKEHLNMSTTDMGLFTAFSFSGMAIVAIIAGAVADRMISKGADPVKVRKSFTLAGLAVASTEVIGALSGSKEIALAFAIISLSGLGLATANYWTLTQTLMPGAPIGRIAGVQNFASTFSGIIAPIITGRLIDFTGNYQAPMIAVSVILGCGLASYIFLVRPKYAPKPIPEKMVLV